MNRTSYRIPVACCCAVLGLALSACAGDEADRQSATDQPTSAKIPTGEVPERMVIEPGENGWDRCEPRSGGFNVWAKNIPCPETNKWIFRLNEVGLAGGGEQGVARAERGWECWSQLEGRFGPIQNVCIREDQLILFDAG